MSFKAVIFDLFGTLVEPFPVPHYHRTIGAMAGILALPQEIFLQRWQHCYQDQEEGRFSCVEDTINAVCCQCDIAPPANQIGSAAHLLLDFTQNIWHPRPDAFDTLAQLHSKGMATGLISNCPPEVPAAWPSSPLAQLIDHAIFSCVVKVRKPAGQIYRMAADELHVQAQDCLYIGDGGAFELSGAKSAEMSAVLLSVPGEEDPYNLSPEARVWAGPRVKSLSEVVLLSRTHFAYF